jgi:hypothetical protein
MANATSGMPFEYLPTSVDVGGVTTEDYLNGQPTEDGQQQEQQPQQLQPEPTEAPPTIVDEFWNQISPDNQGTPNEQ